MPFEYVVYAIFGIWLLGLTFFIISLFRYFNRLTKGAKGTSLTKVLDKILSEQEEASKDISELEREIKRLEEEGTLHIQKVGLIRFNPFKELGGDHSFSLALLDEENTGVILTGLHTRERTRVYVKEVVKGKSKIEHSAEEKKALKKAQKG